MKKLREGFAKGVAEGKRQVELERAAKIGAMFGQDILGQTGPDRLSKREQKKLIKKWARDGQA